MKKNKKKKARRVCSAFLAGSLATCTAVSFLPASVKADSISISPSGSAKAETGVNLGTEDDGRISYSEASKRYANIEMVKTKGGSVRMSFSYDSTPMVSLGNEALDGYEFVRYVITDEKGNSVSRDDLCNLNFTGKVTLGAQFEKKASQEEQAEADQQQRLEEMKSRAKLIKSRTSTGGNISVSIDYTQNPPVHLNASAYQGYKFNRYVIKDEDGKDVALSDLENLNITQKVYVSGVFVKTDSGSKDSGGTTAVDESKKGISYSEALSRYNSITTPKTVTGGTFHMNFNYDSTPMITLTQSAYDGYRFVDFYVTDSSGKAVSMNDFLNLNFTGNVTLTAKFEKTQSSASGDDTEAKKAAVEKKKAAFKLLHFENADGGNIGVSVNYENEKAVTVTNSPASGYKFKNYIIKDSDGKDVSLEDVEKLNITKETTITPVFEKTGNTSSSGSGTSSGTVIQKNHGLTASQALARYDNIEMLGSKNGTYHMSFNFAGQPMVTLTNTPFEGAEFKRYVITDENGKEVSLDDFVNLQFTGKVKITAEFTKKATDTKTDEEKQKEKYEELKAKFKLLTFERADGGNVSAAFSYSSVPPVTVTASPANGYKFSKYIIRNAADENVSLDDVENLRITSKTTVTPVFEKISTGSETNPSKPVEETKNAGLTSAQALARYDNIEMLNSKNGTYHMSFNFSNHPMITLTNTPFEGAKFKRYVITDENGKEISLNDFVNLQFTGKVKITAEFEKTASGSGTDDSEKEKARYEDLKAKFKLLTFKSASGGNVNASFDYKNDPPVTVTASPASGYKFAKYVITDEAGKNVSLDDVENLRITSKTTVTPVFEKTGSSAGGSETNPSKPVEETKNAGLTSAQALARYDNIEMLNSKNGTYHMSFNFSNHPMITLTNTPFEGAKFKRYVITDENGKEVSLNDFVNLQFTGKVKITAEFEKTASGSGTDDSEKEKARYEALKAKFKLLTFKSASGGNVNASFDYKNDPPVTVTASPADGYKFVKYVITDEAGKSVSLDDVENLRIASKTTVTPVFEKTGSSAGGSETKPSKPVEETKNAGLTSAQALARYDNIEMLNSKNGTYHMSFNFSAHPMVTLTNTPFEGAKFKRYVITDEAGREVSLEDFSNLNFSGKVKVVAEFEKDSQASGEDNTEAEKAKYEDLKKRFRNISVKTPTGGNVHMAFDYSANPPVVVTNTPSAGYTFDSYVISDEKGNAVSLEDLQSLNISGPVTLSAKFAKIKTEEEKQEEKKNQPKTNHGLTLEQALARYDRMMLANTKNGTLHAHFDFEKTPIVTLTPDADDGYVFSQYIITDENGNTVSTDDAANLQYTGSITVKTIFRSKDPNTPAQPSKDSSEEEKAKYADLKKKFDMVSLSQAVGGMVSGKFDYKSEPPFKVSEDAFKGYEFKGYSIKDEDGKDVSLEDLQNLNITKKVRVSGIFEKKAADESQTISAETTNAGLTYAQALERYNNISLPEKITGGTLHLSFDFTKTPMVTLTETPEDGYVFRNFIITDENGKTVFADDLCNLNFTGRVSVNALFMKKEESDAKDAYDKEKEKYAWYKEKLRMLSFKKAVGGDLRVKFDYSATPPLSMEAQPYKGYKFKKYKLTYANGHTANLEDVLNLDIRSKVTVTPVFEKANAKKGTVNVSSKEKSAAVDISSEKSKKAKKTTAKKNTKTAAKKAKKTVAKKAKKTVKKTAATKKKAPAIQVFTITSSSSTGRSGRRSAPQITVSMRGKILTYSVRNVKASERVDLQFKKPGSAWKSATDRNLRKMTNGTYYFRARLIGRGYKTSWSSVKAITRNVPVKKHRKAKK